MSLSSGLRISRVVVTIYLCTVLDGVAIVIVYPAICYNFSGAVCPSFDFLMVVAMFMLYVCRDVSPVYFYEGVLDHLYNDFVGIPTG